MLRAVFEEALRLYPPAAILEPSRRSPTTRSSANACRLAPSSSSRPTCCIAAAGSGRAPDAFDPSRFLGERRERIDRFAYIPFGAGPRVCIGMAFAVQEAVIILANLIRVAISFELVEGHEVTPQQRVTLRPRYGMKMHAKRPQSRAKISTS